MEFYKEIEGQVKDLDIGLIVLNAGVAHTSVFAETEVEKLQEMLDTNCY